MKFSHFTLSALLAVITSGACVGSDFELAIRSHPERIKFADPLYIEVTLVNRGTEAVVAAPLSMLEGSLGLKIYDANTRLSMPIGETGGAVGSQRRYEPDKPERFYCLVFLPGLRRFSHPFWKPIGLNGQSVSISASYAISKRLSHRSNAIEVQMESREEAEMRTLEHWASAELPHPGKGPLPNDLGFNFQSGLSRAQTAELAGKLQEGEFHDLLLIALQLRDIYDTPADSREAKNRGLVEWLKKLPDIKRQCLIIEVGEVAEGHQLTSTAEAVKQLIDWK